MGKFKGFGDWVEIFMGGKQTDSEGREHDGDALIDKAVETFDPSKHEPPAVIGHPQDTAPAYAWVEELKTTVKDGTKVLLAKFKQVVPEFEEMVKQGLFKKRSIGIYPDGRLKHVGFLGAAPPAVKGLADLKFEDVGDALTFDFYDPGMGTVARILRNLRDYFIEKEGKEKADAIIPDWDVEYIREESNKETITDSREDIMANGFKEKVKGFLSLLGVDMSKVPDDALPADPPEGKAGAFSEADLDRIKQDAEAEGRRKAESEFAEKGKKDRDKARAKEIADFVDQGIRDKKIPPSWKDAGLVGFMQGLDAENSIEFSEGKKKSSLGWFKEDFLEGLGQSAIFREMATKGDAGTDTSATTEKELGESIAAKANR